MNALFAAKDAAQYLGVHPKTFRRWASAARSQTPDLAPVVNRPTCRRWTLQQVVLISNRGGAR